MEKIKLKEKIGYGLGDMATNMFWKLFSMYLLFFYTDVFGIPAAVVGTMFLVTRTWDSFFDPIVGVICDRTNTRWGKFRPYLLWLAIPFGIMGALTFTTPDWSTNGKIIYAYVTYSIMMMTYSMINVPYASLMGVMSGDPKERTVLSSYRMVFAHSGGLLAIILLTPLVEYFGNDGTSLTRGWSLTAAVFAIISIVLFLCNFLWTRERVKPIVNKSNTLKEDIGDLYRNRPWWMLLCAGISILIFNSIRDGAAIYYFKYYAQVPGNIQNYLQAYALPMATVYLIVGQIFNVVGIILVAFISNYFGKKDLFVYASVLAVMLSIAFGSIERDDIVMMLVLQALISICAGVISPLLWAMYADITDYSEWKTGRRATGLIFSSSSMSQKFGWSIGGAMTGWLLAYFGFEANIVQDVNTQNGIRMMLSILPATGAFLGLIFITLYPINNKLIKRITGELNIKRLNNE